MKDLVAAKLIAMAILAFGSLLSGCLPMATLALLRRRRGNKQVTSLRVSPDSTVLSFFLCFGAGVLLATFICHMVPESLEVWDDVQKDSGMESDVPLPSILIGVGFFLVYLFEELAHLLVHRSSGSAPLHRRSESASGSELQGSTHQLIHGPSQLSATSLRPSESGSGSTISVIELEVHRPSSTPKLHHSHSQGDGEQGHSHGAAIASVQGTFVVILLLIALSFHAILEGMAVGSEDTVDNVYIMLAAVSTHKFILVFVLGLETLTSNLGLAGQLGCVLTFTGSTVAGIGIGIGVLQLEGDGVGQDIAQMVMQTLASGTLMYVCFMEVLTRERQRKQHAMARLGCTALGFTLISVLISCISEVD